MMNDAILQDSLLSENCIDPAALAAVQQMQQSSNAASINVIELMPNVVNNKRHFSGSNSSLQNSGNINELKNPYR